MLREGGKIQSLSKLTGARRRRIGGGPGGGPRGCARWPDGTHPHLLVVGVGSHVTVPCMARLKVMRGDSGIYDPSNQHLTGSLGGLKYYMYTIAKISRSASPIFFNPQFTL
jgi:hypothetical protein